MDRKRKVDPQVAKALRDHNVSTKIVADAFGVTPSAVTHAVQKLEEGPSEAIIGRPTKATPEMDSFLNTCLEAQNDHSDRALGQMIENEFHVHVSYRTVSSWLDRLGWELRSTVRKRELSEINVKRRMAWAKAFKHKLQNECLFVDECDFSSSNAKKKVRVRKGTEPPIVEEVNPRISVQIFAGISYYGKSKIYFLPRGSLKGQGKATTKGSDYLKTLKSAFSTDDAFNEDRIRQFYQDNSPVHTATCVKNWLEQRGLAILDAPPSRFT